MRWKKILSGILVSAMALGAVVSGIPQEALGAESFYVAAARRAAAGDPGGNRRTLQPYYLRLQCGEYL